jgi:hypothetical protein
MKLKKPTNQLAEVLYLLLKNKSVTRRSALLDTGILNVPARIMDLRNIHHIPIVLTRVAAVNKFGRGVNYGSWSILNKANLEDKYNAINK